MKLGDVYKAYDLVRERAARVKKATGLDWEIGGGSQVNLWVTLNGGDTLSEQAQDGICASLVKVFDKAAPNGLTAALAKQGTWDKEKIGASNNQVWCDFPNKVMSQISVEDFVELCDVLMQQGSAEIQKVVGKPSEYRKPNCSMQKKKESLLKKTEVVVAFGKAYQDFVGRCWRDTPDGKKKPNYSETAINFLLDCAHIANGTSVKGLPQQGFKLTKAGNVDIVGDCLHLCYDEVNGKKAVDIWLNPHTQKALVDLYGFNPEDPYSSTHKEFSARDYTSDDFYEFIKNLPNYKGEAKTAESRKLSIRVHEAKTSEVADGQVEHGKECHLFIENDPNYQVSFRSDDGHVYTFYVQAEDPQDALDRAYHEFGVNYNMSIKGEAHNEDDISQGEEAVEVGTMYAPKVNVAVDPWDGKGVRVLYIPEYYLPYIVNGDSSGMEEEDIADCDAFVDSYIKKGYDMVSVSPVCGPQGEWWDQNVQGDVLCSTTID